MMDIRYIGNAPVLHVVDEMLVDNLHWSTYRIIVDQGNAFGKSEIFASIVRASNIELDTTGTESHNIVGIGERYHQPLRNTYRKLIDLYPSQDKALLLQCAVKCRNDTLKPAGLVPSVLVFCVYKPAYTRSEVRPSRIAHDAPIEIAKHKAKLRLNRALRHQVPIASDASFDPGDKVLVCRGKVVNNRIG